MSWRQILLGLILADFLALTAVVLYQHGYVGFFELAFANSATTLLFADLVIVLGLAAVWMWQDARERGVRVLPYLAIGALFGAAGPLLYLIVREHQTRQVAIPQRA